MLHLNLLRIRGLLPICHTFFEAEVFVEIVW